jgi:hypothetical protein
MGGIISNTTKQKETEGSLTVMVEGEHGRTVSVRVNQLMTAKEAKEKGPLRTAKEN